ncbi:MAG: class I SAM-dependent methyltransferase [bacterium]
MSPGTRNDRSYYRRTYRDDDDPWSEMSVLDHRTEQWIEQYCSGNRTNSWMLDLGCGRGRICSLFAKDGFNAVGLDYLEDPLRKARNTHRHDRTFYVRGDAFKVPLQDSTMDTIVDYGCFHHVRKRDWQQYKQEVDRLLCPGGYMFINVFSVEDDHGNRGDRKWNRHKGHYDRFFERDDLRKILGEPFEEIEHYPLQVDGHHFHHHLFKKEPF